MDTMTVDEAKRILGMELDRELAEFFSASPGSVFNWRDKGTLPRGKIAEIELHRIKAKRRARA